MFKLNRIQLFTEKIQGKLYLEANTLIKKSLMSQMNFIKTETIIDCKKEIKSDNLKLLSQKVKDITV